MLRALRLPTLFMAIVPFFVAGFSTTVTAAMGKEATPSPRRLAAAIRYTLDGRVEASLRTDGRLVQAGVVFGVLREDWSFTSPRGVVFARLHEDGRLELAHGNRAAATVGPDGTVTLPNGHRLTLGADGRLGGVPTESGTPRVLGVSPNDRRAAMFVFFAWSMTSARIAGERRQVRELRRMAELVRIQRGSCPASVRALRSDGRRDGAPQTVVDTWGGEYWLECSGTTAPLVVSAGPDRHFGTDDDIRSDR